MSATLKSDETFAEAARRVVLHHLDAARDALSGPEDERVHEVRRRLKRARALIRLVQGALPRKVSKVDRRRARDLGRALSFARDAEAAVEALGFLGEGPAGGEGGLSAVRARLAGERDAARSGGVDAAELDDALRRLEDRARAWTFASSGFGALEPGLESTYRSARHALRAVLQDRTVAGFHEWRKRVKEHSEQIRMLAPVSPVLLGARADLALALGESLGRHHDLAVLAGRADDDDVAARAQEEKRRLEVECLALGRRLFADRPRSFVRRLRVWARVWREENPLD